MTAAPSSTPRNLQWGGEASSLVPRGCPSFWACATQQLPSSALVPQAGALPCPSPMPLHPYQVWGWSSLHLYSSHVQGQPTTGSGAHQLVLILNIVTPSKPPTQDRPSSSFSVLPCRLMPPGQQASPMILFSHDPDAWPSSQP